MSVFQGRGNLLKMQEIAWPLRQPIAALVDDPMKAGAGQSHLSESDEDAMALRAMRQRFLAGSLGRFYSFILVQNDDEPEEPFELYARDAISSLEDVSGLIPVPPSSLAESVNR
jgi:hypothetical protein